MRLGVGSSVVIALVLASCSAGDGATGTAGDDAMSATTAPTTAVPIDADGALDDDAPDEGSVPVDEPGADADDGTTDDAPDPGDTGTDEPFEVGAWSEITPGGDCACADGSEFVFWDRPADPGRVMLFLQGGGACFDATTCAYQGGTYSSDVGAPPELLDGIFAAERPDNPMAGYSTVYVPYCTGDVHLGNRVADYDGLVVNHLGYVNAMAALDHLVAQYPDATEVVVTGISAGSIPSPFYGALLADRLPDATITVIGDGSGAYSRGTSLASDVGSGWGTESVLPDWPSAADVPLTEWSIPGLYVRAAAHAPDLTFARIDFAYDSVQQFFASITGGAPEDLLAEIDANDVWIEEQAGIELHAYTAPGTAHTILLSPAFYDLEVRGVALSDWVADVVSGAEPGDVRCTECR